MAPSFSTNPFTAPSAASPWTPRAGQRIASLPIHIYGLVIAIDEPPEPHAVLDPALHLRLSGFQAVAGRHHLNDELRA